MTRTTPLLAFALLALPMSLAAQKTKPAAAPAGVPPGLDQYVDSVMKAFGVPGISLTIVKDGKVIVAKGYGVRRLGEPTPVDAGTLFGIASNTKVFTSLALGLLVEQGKIDWDAPVVNYLPWFQMYDFLGDAGDHGARPAGASQRPGPGAGDLLWWPASDYTRADIARKLKYIKPATSFRYSYAYDNVLYVVAGELIEAVSGQTWEEFVRANILEPAGMTTSFSHYPAPDQRGNLSSPHAVVEGSLKPVWPDTSAATNPAGGIMTNAQDEAKWLMIMADSGKLADGKRLYSARTARALWMPVTILNNNPPPPQLAPLKANFRGYALGLNMSDYRGYKVAEHTGGCRASCRK
jgi:CubicO group peptidase (beta-lactamase class C family)